MPDTAIAEFYAYHFNSDGLNGRPWQHGRQSHNAFLRNIESALEETGRWSTIGEYRMGGDIRVSIEAVEAGENSGSEGRSLAPQTRTYRVQAEHGIVVRAEYTSLDTALGMLQVFIDFAWGLVSETDAWRGLVFHH
jgi:hypothetical protein